MPPDVSVIIPCYNVAKYIDDCLNSLVRQTLPDIEILCINDGSTDDTWDRLLQWKNRDARILLLDQPNAGVSAARNAGLDAARGLYIGFVDSDDYVNLNMYATLLSAARQYNADIVECGNYVFSDSTGQPIASKLRSPKWNFDPNSTPDNFFRDSIWGRMDICVWNKLYRRNMLEQHRLRFDETLKQGGEDENFRLMAIPHAKRLLLLPDCMYHYRYMRNDSLSGQMDSNTMHEAFAKECYRLLAIVNYWKRHEWLNAGMFAYCVRKLNGFFLPRHRAFSLINSPRKQEMLDCWDLICQQAEGTRFLPFIPKRDQRLVNTLSSPQQSPNGFGRLMLKIASRLPGQAGRHYRLKEIMAGHSSTKNGSNQSPNPSASN